MEEEHKMDLLINEEDMPILVESECEEFKPILEDFIRSYSENSTIPIESWLIPKMQEQLPEKNHEEISAIVEEIIATIKTNEEKQASLEKAIENGRSKESWFASETKKAMSAMSTQEAVNYLTSLDTSLQQANTSLYRTITTQAGTINKNPRLDGFIAEQYHAQTFNMNAEAVGSSYRAKVLEPNGHGYAKNSVDIVIVDADGKVISRYQSKYYKNAKATEKAFEHGDYRGQQKLVPEGQQNDIAKKVNTVLEAPDGTTSNPFTKSRAEQMRDEAQSGNWNELNWNEYAAKDLAIGVGKQAGYAALQGAAIGVGLDIAEKLYNGEEIESDEIVETAIVSGADFGVKAAAAGALKVGAEKEIIKVIPKGIAAETCGNIAFVAVENAKVLGKIATGELTVKEGVDKMGQTTVATMAGIVAMEKGTAIGATIGMTFGPVGAAVGGFVGGTVGYIAGSKVGKSVAKGTQKVRDEVRKVAKTVVSGVKDAASSVTSGVKNFCSGVASFLGL